MNFSRIFFSFLLGMGFLSFAQQSSYKVTKEYDEQGNLIRYDSMRTSSNGYYSVQHTGSHVFSGINGTNIHFMADSMEMVSIDSMFSMKFRPRFRKRFNPMIFIDHWDELDSLSSNMQHIDSVMRCNMKRLFRELDHAMHSSIITKTY